MNLVILTNYRSGSHFLAGLLESNGFDYRGEILPRTKKKISAKYTQDVIRENGRGSRESRNNIMSVKVRENLLDEIKSTMDGSSVCILHREQLDIMMSMFPGKTESNFLLDTFPDARFIFLDRDKYECAISFYFAIKTSEWFSLQQRHSKTVEYDFDEIKKIYERYLSWSWSMDTLDSIGAVYVNYKDLVNSFEDTALSLSKELEIAISSNKSRFEKQENSLKKEYLDRFRKEYILNDYKFGRTRIS